MSEMSRDARRAMRAKIHRLTTQESGKVDASSYGPEETLDAGIKTGMRPLSRRAFKKGGKVVANDGDDAKRNAGKKPRKGGDLEGLADVIVNRNVKEANEAREGKKHIGGMKKGGMVKKAAGGAADGDADDMVPTSRMAFTPASSRLSKSAGLATGGKAGNWIAGAVKHPGALHKELGVPEGDKIPAKKLASAEHSENKTLAKRARLAVTLKRIGKADGGGIADMACADGGRAKRKSGGKTDINIIISAGPKSPPQQPGPPGMPPPGFGGVPGAPPPGAGGPPPMAGPPPGLGGPPPGGGMPPPGLGGPPPMPRKSGGRVATGHHTAGAGSGEGRLEKTAIAKRNG